MTATIDVGIPLRNADGYPDPTCYQALKEIQLAEYGYRPLVYICSPYSLSLIHISEPTRPY